MIRTTPMSTMNSGQRPRMIGNHPGLSRRKCQLFNLKSIKSVTDSTDDVTSRTEIARCNKANAPAMRSTMLARSQSVYFGGTRNSLVGSGSTNKDSSQYVRVLPRLGQDNKNTPKSLTRRNSSSDESSAASQTQQQQPPAKQFMYSRGRRQSVSSYNDLKSAKATKTNDRRTRVSRLYSDLRQRTPVNGNTINFVNTYTTVPNPKAGVIQMRISSRRQIDDRNGYDPRPQDVVEKCEKWIQSLPSTFSNVCSVLPVPEDSSNPESENSDEDSEQGRDRRTTSNAS